MFINNKSRIDFPSAIVKEHINWTIGEKARKLNE
tara:strand:- start:376 stop:477 length:102 start_codon:yes stop_codon:yes gene_type:complete